MEFNSKKSIYHQISDLICENILLGKYGDEERLFSVRELAGKLEVNPNTVMRAYSYLQDEGIIYNKRGIGYFISQGARELVLSLNRGDFITKELPEVFKSAKLYSISADEFCALYSDYLKGEVNEK